MGAKQILSKCIRDSECVRAQGFLAMETRSVAAVDVATTTLPFPQVELRNPFVVKVGQVITGAGVGCGVGIGIGKPLNIGNQLLPLGEINRLVGKSGRHVQQLLKKVGLKGRVDAGIGCGVGVGHGFVLVGIGLKPGLPEQILQFAQDTLKALKSRFGPQLGPLTLVENKIVAPGMTSSNGSHVSATTLAGGITSMLPNYSQIGPKVPPSAGPSLLQMQKLQQHAQNDEVERLKLEKEILQTLLRQQRQIEELNSELKIVRGQNGDPQSLRTDVNAEQRQASNCFECKRKARRRR